MARRFLYARIRRRNKDGNGKNHIKRTKKGSCTKSKAYPQHPTNRHMTTAHSSAQNKCVRKRIWVIFKFVVDGGSLELVDTRDDKVTREGVISRKNGKKRHATYAGRPIGNM